MAASEGPGSGAPSVAKRQHRRTHDRVARAIRSAARRAAGGAAPDRLITGSSARACCGLCPSRACPTCARLVAHLRSCVGSDGGPLTAAERARFAKPYFLPLLTQTGSRVLEPGKSVTPWHSDIVLIRSGQKQDKDE